MSGIPEHLEYISNAEDKKTWDQWRFDIDRERERIAKDQGKEQLRDSEGEK